MDARVEWVGERTFVGVSGSGHGVVMGARYQDRPAPGPSPMEMLLLGLGACTAFDVVHILERGREPVTGCEVAVEAERAEADPQVFTRVHMRYVITGKGLARAKAERAVALSEEKYCSASAMFIKTAEMTREVEVVDTAG
jgi:putative redox protein